MVFSTNPAPVSKIQEAAEYIDAWQSKLAKQKGSPLNSVCRLFTQKDPAARLNEIEIECLRWVAAGKTLQDVAEITGKSYKSIRYHLDKARSKYGYPTINQTLVQATHDYSLSPFGAYDLP